MYKESKFVGVDGQTGDNKAVLVDFEGGASK